MLKMAGKIRTVHERRLTKSHLWGVMILTSLCWVALDVYLFYFSNISIMSGNDNLPVEVRKEDALYDDDVEQDWKNVLEDGDRAEVDGGRAELDRLEDAADEEDLDFIKDDNGDIRRGDEHAEQRVVQHKQPDVMKAILARGQKRTEAPPVRREVGLEMDQMNKQEHDDERLVKNVRDGDPGVVNPDNGEQDLNDGDHDDDLNPPEPQAAPHDIKPVWERLRNYDVRTLDARRDGPGENGKGHTVDAKKPEVKLGWKHASFNEYLSDLISVERALPDVKHRTCNSVLYPYNVLPKTSIIVCFTDESWSTLLRTVHSILNRTPPELLEEILLVDDDSTKEHLKAPLDEYVKKLGNVRVLHLPRREGLIRARLVGVREAVGPVLTFLDSHIECTKGWLEPMLFRVWQERRAVVSPLIDNIDKTTFSYAATSANLRGGFGWNLQFKWKTVPQYERNRRKNETEPLRTPTIAGGLFSIRKDYFYELGTYDPGLEIWGGENLEISFKTWMCGGTLELMPCSHVGHIFRDTQPYSFPDRVKTFLKNCKRIAEVWLDDYKEAFYMVRPELRQWKIGDISAQLQLREDLHCKDFTWYLQNVASEYEVPEWKVQAQGEGSNLFNKRCMDSANAGYLSIFHCHKLHGNQDFRLSLKGLLQSGENCVTKVGNASPLLRMASCNSARVIIWTHTKGEGLVDVATKQCLDVQRNKVELVLMPCNYVVRPMQKWIFTEYFDETGENRIY